MSSFAIAFKEPHSIEKTLEILREDKEQSATELGRKTRTAIETMHADLLMLSQSMPRRFNPKTTEADVIQKLKKLVRETWEDDESLNHEQAILQVVEKYQTPFYPDMESVDKRTAEIRQEENALALERHLRRG